MPDLPTDLLAYGGGGAGTAALIWFVKRYIRQQDETADGSEAERKRIEEESRARDDRIRHDLSSLRSEMDEAKAVQREMTARTDERLKSMTEAIRDNANTVSALSRDVDNSLASMRKEMGQGFNSIRAEIGSYFGRLMDVIESQQKNHK